MHADLTASPHAFARPQLAALYSADRDTEQCTLWAHKALKRNPSHFGAHTGLGLALEQEGQFHQAIDAFRTALSHHPWAANVPTILSSLQHKLAEEAAKASDRKRMGQAFAGEQATDKDKQ
jgi:Flp pilus assembly protein TadD